MYEIIQKLRKAKLLNVKIPLRNVYNHSNMKSSIGSITASIIIQI